MHPLNKILGLLDLRLSRTVSRTDNTKNISFPKYSYKWLNHTVFTEILNERNGKFRPHYLWGVLQGVNLAKAIGINHVSIIEFGVAGGNGLISLEHIAERVESIFDVKVDVYGFDTGFGLPEPQDYRDEPHVHIASDYKMDTEKLQKRLKRSKLILGLINETVKDFIKNISAPIAFVSIDVDFYSSSMHALQILDAKQELLLPRVYFYFDDIMGPTKNEYAGERLAILDFNASHEKRKIAPIHGLKYHLPLPYAKQQWVEMSFIAHIFNHKLYGRFDGLSPASDLSLIER